MAEAMPIHLHACATKNEEQVGAILAPGTKWAICVPLLVDRPKAFKTLYCTHVGLR